MTEAQIKELVATESKKAAEKAVRDYQAEQEKKPVSGWAKETWDKAV